MDVLFLKKNCGAKREGKKKSGKLFCGNGIVEIEGKKTICHFFFLLFQHHNFFLEMIRSQYFHNIFTTNPKWKVVTDYYYWGKKVILVLDSNLNQ